MNHKPILYDLGVALGAIGLWLTPFNASRILGYSISLAFAGDAYYRGLMLIAKERKIDEKEAIAYEAETDFYDQLLGSNIEAELEVRALQVENRMLQRMIPLMQQKTALERQLTSFNPVHPEMSENDREQAARNAIEGVFEDEERTEQKEPPNEETIRENFPENMDGTYWKAICKALGSGSARTEICKDIIGGDQQLASAYYELLKKKYL